MANILIKAGLWLESRSKKAKLSRLETIETKLVAVEKENKELKDRVTRLEMYVGFRKPEMSTNGIKENITLWNTIAGMNNQ